MKKIIVISFILASISVESEVQQDTQQTKEASKTQILKPTMKVIEKDWPYFAEIPCDNIQQYIGQNLSEKKYIIKRKKQCMNKYNAFFPQPVNK